MPWQHGESTAKPYVRKPPTRHPDTNKRHFCRSCDAVFEPGDGDESAHTTARIHVIREHDDTQTFSRCSRNCLEVEQPEETTLGRKLYGVKYDQRPSPFNTGYAYLFPEDED